MLPDLAQATLVERLLALGAVLGVALITFFLGRWAGRRMKGWTRLGLHGLERLAAPITLLVIAGGSALLLVPISTDPEVFSFAAELLATFACFWLISRALEVFWVTGEHSARLRHHQVARAVLLSARRLGKVIIWLGAVVTLAVKLGAAAQLYLVLGGLGAALAFAARDPIRNVFAFASMIVDPPFQLGDRVRMEEFRGGTAAEGTVLAITLSSVTLETAQHTRVVVSNLRVADLRVENLSAADRRRLELMVPVPQELSTEALRSACDEIESDLRRHPQVSDEHAPRVWLSGSAGGLQLRASFWLRRASRRRDSQREVLLLMRERLEQPRTPRRDPSLSTQRRTAPA